jgi:hypothetical protein
MPKKKINSARMKKDAEGEKAAANRIRDKAAEGRKKSKGLDFSQNALRIVRESTKQD